MPHGRSYTRWVEGLADQNENGGCRWAGTESGKDFRDGCPDSGVSLARLDGGQDQPASRPGPTFGKRVAAPSWARTGFPPDRRKYRSECRRHRPLPGGRGRASAVAAGPERELPGRLPDPLASHQERKVDHDREQQHPGPSDANPLPAGPGQFPTRVQSYGTEAPSPGRRHPSNQAAQRASSQLD